MNMSYHKEQEYEWLRGSEGFLRRKAFQEVKMMEHDPLGPKTCFIECVFVRRNKNI